MNFRKTLCFLMLATAFIVNAQTNTDTIIPKPTPEKKWYEKMLIRGYIQARYNGLLETNENLGCDQCDRALGADGGVSLKRARVNLLGQVYKNVYFKLEVDFATAVSGTQNFAQVRDAYFDIGLDKDNEYWIRIGQSKIPYGFEILQSSQNRLTLDRSDAINSAFLQERDMGAFFYWAPKEIRQLYRDINSNNLKGSGDFGVIGIGVFNGQTANKPEMNKSQHVVARVSYPFKVGSQMIEPGIQGYSGKYVMFDNQLTSGIITNANKEYTDTRAAVSFILYPKPFGIQAEYNVGKGPEFDKASQSIKVKDLNGGYVTISYKIPYKMQVIFPYTRYQYYRGGKKFETDARSYSVNQLDLGVEYQFSKNFELSAEYMISDRRYEDFALQNNHQTGNLLRLQAQMNF